MTDTQDNKQQVQLYLKGNYADLSDQRQTAAIKALAAALLVPPDAIDLYDVFEGSIVFELGLPSGAVSQLQMLLEANSPRLRLLGIKRVVLEKKSGDIEEWALEEGQFKCLSGTPDLVSNDVKNERRQKFKPIPGIWRFHLIYLFVTLAIAISAFPHTLFYSLLPVSGICAVGIGLARKEYFMAVQILALAVGLGTPVIIFTMLIPIYTVVFLATLIVGVTLIRHYIF